MCVNESRKDRVRGPEREKERKLERQREKIKIKSEQNMGEKRTSTERGKQETKKCTAAEKKREVRETELRSWENSTQWGQGKQDDRLEEN